MATASNVEVAQEDLIDLHVGSPVLSRLATSSSSSLDESESVEEESRSSESLLDLELPVLVRRFSVSVNPSSPETGGTTSSINYNINNTSNCAVDIEDILISLDDDGNNVVLENDRCSNNQEEALNVLRQLDQILLDQEVEYNDEEVSSASTRDDRLSVEDCLEDLDNYLKAFDSSVSEDDCVEEEEDDDEEGEFTGGESPHLSTVSDALSIADSSEPNEEEPGQINSAFVDDDGNVKGSRSFLRQHPTRATIAATSGMSLQVTEDENATVLEKGKANHFSASDIRSSVNHADNQQSPGRISAEGEEEVAKNWIRERHVASSDQDRHPPSPERNQQGLSWLRSSMRRIRHLRLPSAGENEANANRADVVVIAPSSVVVVQIDPPEANPADENALAAAGTAVPASCARPFSAPSRLAPHRGENSASTGRRSLSSSESSLASSANTTRSCTPATTPSRSNVQEPTSNHLRSCERASGHNDMPQTESPLGHWPHSFSSMFACLSCTVGLFNISRFAILSVYFGANFIFQFFLLSILIGLPLFTLQLCLGQQLGAGVIDMWRISPLFQGVGVALLVSQALIGLYSIMGVSWMLVYFRDSFITKTDTYRWAEPYLLYRNDAGEKLQVDGSANNTTSIFRSIYKLSETVPDYFSGVVLQRHHLNSSRNSLGTIKFQLAFNLAVVWMIVFVCLSKGLRSYGKVVYVFAILPIFGTFIVCAKILSLVPPGFVYVVFPETSWSEFFLNTKSWVAASQEVFLTWGLLGTAVMQLASHNKHKNLLYRDSSLIAVITFAILLLGAFLANTCIQILHSNGYMYLSSSFEKMKSYSFLKTSRDIFSSPSASTTIPVKYMNHQSFIVGDRIFRPGHDSSSESGYQVLRLATELVPTTFALIGPDEISPFWVVLFYFTLILFGIAQQLAIWHCVITGILAIKASILKSWETTITFFSCACGYLLGLSMATEFGIYVVYFMDFTIGGMWWLVLITVIKIVAVFMIRGRPYSGDSLVNTFFMSHARPCLLSWAPALLSFTWNVILPVGLTVCCVSFFRNGNFKELFVWHHAPSYEYWPLWARQIGSMLQLLPILCVPIIAVVQSYRYLNNGPSDILDRVQLLYRPPLGEHMEDLPVREMTSRQNSSNSTTTVTTSATEDPPPKYTPPPSYTTATGARIAKFLRQSIRRSIRRITNALGEGSSGNSNTNRACNQRNRSSETNHHLQAPPPDYSVVLDEIATSSSSERTSVNVIGCRQQSMTPFARELSAHTQAGSALTIADVASILRNSFRRSRISRAASNFRRSTAVSSIVGGGGDANPSSLSAENLVDSAAPIGETSLVMMESVTSTNNNDEVVDAAASAKADHFSSVI